MIGSRKSTDGAAAIRHHAVRQDAIRYAGDETRGRTNSSSPGVSLSPLIFLIVGAGMSATCFGQQTSAQQDTTLQLPAHVQSLITTRCMDCHNEDSAEAGVRLDNFASLTKDAQLELLNRAQDQIFF